MQLRADFWDHHKTVGLSVLARDVHNQACAANLLGILTLSLRQIARRSTSPSIPVSPSAVESAIGELTARNLAVWWVELETLWVVERFEHAGCPSAKVRKAAQAVFEVQPSQVRDAAVRRYPWLRNTPSEGADPDGGIPYAEVGGEEIEKEIEIEIERGDARARAPDPPHPPDPPHVAIDRERGEIHAAMAAAIPLFGAYGNRLDYAVERCLEGRHDPGAGTCEPEEARRCVEGYQGDTAGHHCRLVDLFSRVNWPETQRRYLGRTIVVGVLGAGGRGYMPVAGDHEHQERWREFTGAERGKA